MKKKKPSCITQAEIIEIEEFRKQLTELSQEEAGIRFTRLLELSQNRDFTEHEQQYLDLLFVLGEYCGRNEMITDAQELFLRIIAFAKKRKHPSAMLHAQANYAITKAQSGFFHDAIEVWESMLQQDVSIEMQQGLLNNLCVGFGMLGEINRSIYYAFKAIEFSEQHDLLTRNISPLINLGSGYEKRGEYQKAVETWERGYKIALANQQIRNACDTCINLSLGYNSLGETDKALEFAEHALNLRKEHFPELDLGIPLNNFGYIYETSGDLEAALAYYIQAQECFDRGFDQIARANCQINIASIHVKTHQWDAALAYLTQATELCTELQLPNLFLKLNGLYAEVYAGKGMYKKAFQHQKQLADQLQKNLDENTANSITKMEAEYYRNKIARQAELYHKQNIELRKNNRIIRHNTRKLQQINSEQQDTLEMLNWDVSVITHDVRAPLAHISQVLAMINDGAFPDREIPELLRALQDSSQRTYGLIDEILDGIRLQRTRLDTDLEIDTLDVIPILQSLVGIYKPIAQQKSIKLESRFAAATMPAKIDISLLKIVIRNLLNNSIKFTPEYGFIHLSADYQDNFLIITIRDSGKGLTKSERRNLMKSKVSSLSKNTWIKGIGLGFSLCQQSLKRMNGKISIDSKPGEGTTFRITLPR